MKEPNSRIIIDKLLRESDWILYGDEGVVNVDTEMQNEAGFADYVLKDSSDFPLCVIEAKKELLSPLVGKEQARAILPLNQYTEVYWTASFQAVMNFIELRNEKTSQWEIQEYARVMLDLMKETFPKITKIWSEAHNW